MLDYLSGNVRAFVRNSGHAVSHDRLPLRDGEEELVVHPDVDAQHDAIGHLEADKKHVFFVAVKMHNYKSSPERN